VTPDSQKFPALSWIFHIGETVTTCGLVVEQRTHHQITGEPMKFLTLADWTGMMETELFAQTYKNYGLATVRFPVLEVTATVREWAGIYVASVAGGKDKDKSSFRADCPLGLKGREWYRANTP